MGAWRVKPKTLHGFIVRTWGAAVLRHTKTGLLTERVLSTTRNSANYRYDLMVP
jgi:hypothetical protein